MLPSIEILFASVGLLSATLIPFTPITPDENRYLQDTCGRMSTPFDKKYSNTHTKVLNGNQVKAGFGSWVVRLDKISRAYCGGTLISPRHVLTAMHCGVMAATDRSPFRINVRVGNSCTRQSCANDMDVYRVKSVVSLPMSRKMKDYEVISGTTMYYGPDLTLVELTEPVDLAKVQPACLNTDPTISDNGRFAAAGWGNDGNGHYDRLLWSEQVFNGTREEMVRTLAHHGNQMTLDGDSGSGLIMVTDRVYVLGPLSNGPTKEDLLQKTALPLSLYTNVAKYLDFICHFTGVCPPGANRDGVYLEGRDFNVCDYEHKEFCQFPEQVELEE